MAAYFPLALILGPPGRWRDSLGVLLQASGTTTLIDCADDARSGLNLIYQARAALVLLDAGLPEDEAWWALEQIRRSGSQARSIIIAHTYDQERRALQAGADAVLQAGFSGDSLFSAIRRLLPLDESSSVQVMESNIQASNDRTGSNESASICKVLPQLSSHQENNGDQPSSSRIVGSAGSAAFTRCFVTKSHSRSRL